MLGWRGMIGLIVPSNNNVIMPEVYRLLPEGVTAYETRMAVAGELTFDKVRKMVEQAVAAGEMMQQVGVDVIAYCCMGSSIIKGWAWEDELMADLERFAPRGATSANRALAAALERFGARNVALITPYPAELNALLPDFFKARGFAVKALAGIEVRHMSEVRLLSPDRLYRLARGLDLKGVDALCLLATDMETTPVIGAIERDLGLPVVSSNTAIVAECLRRLGVGEPRPGYGRLLG